MSASSSKPKMNLRSTAVKRIMQEAAELAADGEADFVAAPLEDDIFEWHCTLRGVPESDYDGGLYHLRILLPPTYPMSAPDIILLTPNGRFELGKKICIDGLTSFHAGSWQPAWGVRTAITGLRSFWMQGGEALSAIGALNQPPEERRRLAKASHEWECQHCGKMKDQIPELEPEPKRAERGQHLGSASEAPASSSSAPPSSNGPAETPAVEVETPADPSIAPRLEARDEVPQQLQQQQPPPAPTPTTTAAAATPLQRPAAAPLWIDGLIVAGVAVLFMLLYRKITNPSNLIETVSL